jgi:hypothetical protein
MGFHQSPISGEEAGRRGQASRCHAIERRTLAAHPIEHRLGAIPIWHERTGMK